MKLTEEDFNKKNPCIESMAVMSKYADKAKLRIMFTL